MKEDPGFYGRLIAVFACVVGFAPGFSIESKAAETFYVQSAQADVKGAAKMDAPTVATVKRGDALQVTKKDGLWYQVTVNGKTGFISRLFVNTHPPVGEADLNKVNGSLAKSNRKRSSGYGVTAATRGLSSGNRTRQNRDGYESDTEALGRLEAIEVKPEELKEFKSKAGLKGE